MPPESSTGVTSNGLPLRTSRLILRRLREADLASFLAYHNDPEITRYQSWSGLTEAQARAFLGQQHEQEPGLPGQWLQLGIEVESTGEHIGDCALLVLGDDPQQGEIGYTVARPHQGRGYATEAVGGLLEYGFGHLDLHRVRAHVDCENTPSCALLERLGFRREGHFLESFWDEETRQWRDEYLYALLAAEWRTHA